MKYMILVAYSNGSIMIEYFDNRVELGNAYSKLQKNTMYMVSLGAYEITANNAQVIHAYMLDKIRFY